MKISVTIQLPTAWWEVFNQLNKQAEEDAVCHLQLDMEKFLKQKMKMKVTNDTELPYHRQGLRHTASVSGKNKESICLFATRRVHWCHHCHLTLVSVRYCWDSSLHEDWLFWRATNTQDVSLRMTWTGRTGVQWCCSFNDWQLSGRHYADSWSCTRS